MKQGIGNRESGMAGAESTRSRTVLVLRDSLAARQNLVVSASRSLAIRFPIPHSPFPAPPA